MKRLLLLLFLLWSGMNAAPAALFDPIDIGSAANDGTGDKPRPAGIKINAGFLALEQALVNSTNDLRTLLTTIYQPLDPDLTAWAAVNPSDYLTTSSAAATYQPIGSYATPADIADATNRSHLRITNNTAFVVHVLTAASNATNYVLNIAQREQLVDVTGNVRFVGFTGDLTGYGLGGSIMLSNGTGSAYTVEFTNTWKALRGHTNTIPANGVSWVAWKARSGRISYGAVPEQ